MVRNIFKKDKAPSITPPPPSPPVPPTGAPVQPTLLQKERERLADAQSVLAEIQLAQHNQQLVIGHIRENISLLELNPWFEALYTELRSREERVGPPIPKDFVDAVKRARDAGVLDPVKEHGTL